MLLNPLVYNYIVLVGRVIACPGGSKCGKGQIDNIQTKYSTTRRMHGIVGERERSNCEVDMRCI